MIICISAIQWGKTYVFVLAHGQWIVFVLSHAIVHKKLYCSIHRLLVFVYPVCVAPGQQPSHQETTFSIEGEGQSDAMIARNCPHCIFHVSI